MNEYKKVVSIFCQQYLQLWILMPLFIFKEAITEVPRLGLRLRSEY